MATILPKKAGFEQPMALDDDHHEMLAADPSIQQFPQGSSFGDNNAVNISFGGSPAFSSPPTGGFGSPSGFGSPASTGFGSSSGFGASTSGFGATTSSKPATGKSARFAEADPDSVFDRG